MFDNQSPSKSSSTPETIDDIQALKPPSRWSDGIAAFQNLAYGISEKFVRAIYLHEATHELEIQNLHEGGARTSFSKFTLTESSFKNLYSEIVKQVRSPYSNLQGNNLTQLTFKNPSGETDGVYCIVSQQTGIQHSPSGKGVFEYRVLAVAAVPSEKDIQSIHSSAWTKTPFNRSQVAPPTDVSQLKEFLQKRLSQLSTFASFKPQFIIHEDRRGDYVEIRDITSGIKAQQIMKYIGKNFTDLECRRFEYRYKDAPDSAPTFWSVHVKYRGADSSGTGHF